MFGSIAEVDALFVGDMGSQIRTLPVAAGELTAKFTITILRCFPA